MAFSGLYYDVWRIESIDSFTKWKNLEKWETFQTIELFDTHSEFVSVMRINFRKKFDRLDQSHMLRKLLFLVLDAKCNTIAHIEYKYIQSDA